MTASDLRDTGAWAGRKRLVCHVDCRCGTGLSGDPCATAGRVTWGVETPREGGAYPRCVRCGGEVMVPGSRRDRARESALAEGMASGVCP